MYRFDGNSQVKPNLNFNKQNETTLYTHYIFKFDF